MNCFSEGRSEMMERPVEPSEKSEVPPRIIFDSRFEDDRVALHPRQNVDRPIRSDHS